MPSRFLHLRRPDACCVCNRAIPAGTRAWWDAHNRAVTCLDCRTGCPASGEPLPEARAELVQEARGAAALDRGRAGASAGREHLRRRRNREARTRARHPHLGGLLLAFKGSPRHELAFRQGARGERTVARALERRTARGPAVILHDRRMPGGYGNIDHLAVAPRGVFVIDAKAVRGKVRVARPLLGRQELRVRGRNRQKLLDGLDRQVAAVRGVLDRRGHRDVPVAGVLCFTEADLPLFGAEIRGHRLDRCRGLARRLNRRGSLSADAIDELARTLASDFPAA